MYTLNPMCIGGIYLLLIEPPVIRSPLNWVKISQDLQDGITVWLVIFSVNRFLRLTGYKLPRDQSAAYCEQFFVCLCMKYS